VYANGSNKYSASIFSADMVGVKVNFAPCFFHIFCSHLLLAPTGIPLPALPFFPLSPADLSDHSPCSVSVYTNHAITAFILYLKMEAE